jgi:hypothetical protein
MPDAAAVTMPILFFKRILVSPVLLSCFRLDVAACRIFEL